VDLKIDGFFYFDFQRITSFLFSQPLRGGYIWKNDAQATQYNCKNPLRFLLLPGAPQRCLFLANIRYLFFMKYYCSQTFTESFAQMRTDVKHRSTQIL